MRTMNTGGVASLLGVMACLTLGFSLVGNPAPVVDAQTDTWTTEVARKHGVRLLETRDASGPPAYPVNPGDVLFFTNTGTAYGAKNTRNAVVVINARTRAVLAISDLEPAWSEKFVSHGIGVSPDAQYVYLPAIFAPREATNPGSLLVLDARTLKIAQIVTTPGERAHHVKIFEDASGRQRMLVEEFNYGRRPGSSGVAQGFYVIDPFDHNKVVAGMGSAELRGTETDTNPYTCFAAPEGRYLYCSMPAGQDLKSVLAGRGSLAKVDMQTWKLVESLPMGAYPIWTVFSQDGQWAWVSQAGDDKVLKIQRASAPGQADKIVGEVPTGDGPYGLRMSIDDRELWVADKGEGNPVRGRTVTVIDVDANRVKQTIETGCIFNDHLILSPDGQEMWATCNQSQEVVVLDTRTYQVKARIPMPNQGDAHGGSFVSYTAGPRGIVGETVSDISGLHGSALAASRRQ